MRHRNSLNRETGGAMMEVLVSIFVVSIGVLGILALQAQSLRLNTQSYTLSQAVILANTMAEKIRANKLVADAYAQGSIDVATTPNTECITTACSESELKEADLQNWSYQLQKALPNGRGTITGQAPQIIITITFDSSTEGMPSDDNDWNTYSTVVGIKV